MYRIVSIPSAPSQSVHRAARNSLPWAQRNAPNYGRNWAAGVQTQSTGYSCWNIAVEERGAEP